MTPKNTTIRATKLKGFFRHIDEGRFAIPRLQREFVWNGPKAAKLFDSIHAGMPIGIIMIWETPKTHRLFLRQKYHVLPKFNTKNGKVWFLIDGQQRVSVLYRVREGSTVMNARGKEIDFSRVVLSLEQEEDGQQIRYRMPLQGSYEPLAHVLHPYWSSRLSHLGKRDRQRGMRFGSIWMNPSARLPRCRFSSQWLPCMGVRKHAGGPCN